MFTLLKVAMEHPGKRILHTRRNGDFVQELSIGNAVVHYELPSNHLRRIYAFFIIETELSDVLIYGDTEHHVTTFNSDNILYSYSLLLKEMYEQLLKQGKTLPEKFDNLLKHYLPLVFGRIVQCKSDFSNVSIWNCYSSILEDLGKKANDYVSQSSIDSFIKKLCDYHEIWQMEVFLQSDGKTITISPEVHEFIGKSKNELEETIKIAKKLISTKKYSDMQLSANDVPFLFLSCQDTPCGKIDIYIDFRPDFFVRLSMDNNLGISTYLPISEECKEFESNFRQP